MRLTLSNNVVFDSTIDDRIKNEILANAYNEHEIAMGWVTYLENQLTFPFTAQYIDSTGTVSLEWGHFVTVTSFDRKRSDHTMFVTVKNEKGESFPVLLSQLDWVDADESTIQGMTDWHYWLNNR